MNEKADKRHHILIVDDISTNIDILVNMLRYNYRLGIAKNGEKALVYAKSRQPQLILLDIMMPGMDGYEVLKRLKESSETEHLAVIFITAMHETENKTRGFKMGAVDYITKPFIAAEVKARVKTHLSLVDYRDRLEEKVRVRTAQLEAANMNLANMQMQIIQRLGKAGEYKDYETGKHSIRVSLYSGILAEAMGLDKDLSKLIRLCSPMHDLGKIGIPDQIILKQGPLDKNEWEVMKHHCQIGADLLLPGSEKETISYDEKSMIKQLVDLAGNSKLLDVAMKIAAWHHEKWDGSGYPDGMDGEDIPIEARIVAVADMFDALSSKRPYKEAYSVEKCLKIIKNSSGNALDPKIVDAFFSSINNILQIREDLKD